MRPRSVLVGLLLGLGAACGTLACSLLADTSGLIGSADNDGAAPPSLDGGGAGARDGSPSSGDDAASVVPDAGGDAAGGRCAPGAGPTMIEVTTLEAKRFCIDTTEVTQTQYSAFLAAKGGDTSGQPPECAFNTSFIPTDCGQAPFDPTTKGTEPVVCVDWCDARAFCAWNGKRLCGRIGGGALPAAEVSDPTKDQWYAACSKNGALAYPYGSTFDGGACTISPSARAPVGSKTTCEGGYTGLFDMSGNAGEWQDGCTPVDGGVGYCPYRGGTFRDDKTSPFLRCDNGTAGAYLFGDRNVRNADIGFRCCAD